MKGEIRRDGRRPNERMTYDEYQDQLLDCVYEAREMFERARTAEEKLALAEPYKLALRDLELFLLSGTVPEKPKAAAAGGF